MKVWPPLLSLPGPAHPTCLPSVLLCTPFFNPLCCLFFPPDHLVNPWPSLASACLLACRDGKVCTMFPLLSLVSFYCFLCDHTNASSFPDTRSRSVQAQVPPLSRGRREG